MARRSRKGKGKGSRSAQPNTVHPDAAGLDVGATAVYAAVRPDRDPDPIRNFPTFTGDLHALANWLKECQVTTVAMESTGVYWIPVFQILEAHGFDVVLVNARHVHSVPGRKSDVADSEWLRYLHSVGLLRASFRPADEVCAVRALLRHRDNLIKTASRSVLHMQKAFDQMNVHLHHAISDLTGVTGLAITDAILDGERDPARLADLADRRIKASRATLIAALEGDWRPEHLFTLRHARVVRFLARMTGHGLGRKRLLDTLPAATYYGPRPSPSGCSARLIFGPGSSTERADSRSRLRSAWTMRTRSWPCSAACAPRCRRISSTIGSSIIRVSSQFFGRADLWTHKAK